jgi:hypothetical protein
LLSIYFLCVLGVRAYRRERIVDTIELGSQILVAPPGFAKLSEISTSLTSSEDHWDAE